MSDTFPGTTHNNRSNSFRFAPPEANCVRAAQVFAHFAEQLKAQNWSLDTDSAGTHTAVGSWLLHDEDVDGNEQRF